MDDIKRKRIQKLTDKGVRLFADGKYTETLQVAWHLEDEKGHLGFSLAAQAYAGMNDFDSAVAEMRRGVLIAPHVWLNWFFYAIYLEKIERHESALAAYQQALLCPLANSDLVHLNMAILSENRNEYESALTFLEGVHDPAMRWGIDGTRVLALEGLGRLSEAEELAEAFLKDKPESDDEYGKRVGFIVAALARIRLRRGASEQEVRGFLMQSLEEYGCSTGILGEIRNLDLRYDSEAKRFQIVVGATLPLGHPWRREAGGYGVLYDVVAVSESEALVMIHEFESQIGVDILEVMDSKVVEEMPDQPLGVYWVTERVF